MNRGRLLGTAGQEILQRKRGAAGADRDDPQPSFLSQLFCFLFRCLRFSDGRTATITQPQRPA